MTAGGRLLGVDWGERRIGLALSDETQVIAAPLATLTRRPGKRPPVSHILTECATHGVTGVVVGLPLDEEGKEGDAAAAARRLAEDIARRGKLPVELWDERLTTRRALRTVHELGGSAKGRKEDVDALAATILLQNYLDARKSG